MLRTPALLFALLAPAALAQAPATPSSPVAPTSVYVGVGLPHAPDGLAEVRKRGPALDFGLDFPFEGETLQVQFSIRRFGIDEDYYTNSSGTPDIDGGQRLRSPSMSGVPTSSRRGRPRSRTSAVGSSRCSSAPTPSAARTGGPRTTASATSLPR